MSDFLNENEAEEELKRIEKWEARLASNDNVSDKEIEQGLMDASEPLRADILDYLIEADRSENMIEVLCAFAQRENAVQCVARLAFISYAWEAPQIKDNIRYRPTIDESEYILTWEYAGRFVLRKDKASIAKLSVQAELDDWELSNLSRNLLEHLNYELLISKESAKFLRDLNRVLRTIP